MADQFQPEPPVCVAILLCDLVVEDIRTRNKTFVNAFNSIAAQSLPAVHSRLSVVASITSVLGEMPLDLILAAPDGHEMLRLRGHVESDDPLDVLDIVFDLNGLPLEQEGVHRFDVFADGRHMGGRKFQVTVMGR